MDGSDDDEMSQWATECFHERLSVARFVEGFPLTSSQEPVLR